MKPRKPVAKPYKVCRVIDRDGQTKYGIVSTHTTERAALNAAHIHAALFAPRGSRVVVTGPSGKPDIDTILHEIVD